VTSPPITQFDVLRQRFDSDHEHEISSWRFSVDLNFLGPFLQFLRNGMYFDRVTPSLAQSLEDSRQEWYSVQSID
jgi:hypothetical protein